MAGTQGDTAAPGDPSPAVTEETATGVAATDQPTSTGAAAGPTAPGGVPGELPRADDDLPLLPDLRLPSRKDTSLKEFLNKMDEYAPIVR